jgi:hypothetical protein
VAKAFDTLAKAVQPETSVNPVCIKWMNEYTGFV